MPPQRETATFFHSIYGEDAPGWLFIFTLPNKVTAWVKGTDLDSAVRLALASSKAGLNVYAPVGLQREHLSKGRGTAATVGALTGMWADIDVAGPAHAKATLPPTDTDALALLDECPLSPTVLVHSGHGLQAWWCFREPWVFDGDDEHEEAATLARRWQATLQNIAARHGWTIDAAANLDRVLRVPGTTNWKIPGAPLPVRLLRYQHE